jgi:MFS family permease
MDMGGEHSGTVSGMMNMAGNIGGALSPIVFGVLVQFGSWQAPFIVAASLLVLGAAVWAFWLDPGRSVVEEKETSRTRKRGITEGEALHTTSGG